MVLDLGWSTDYFHNWINTLREEIVEDYLKDIPHESQESMRFELMHRLKLELGYFDQAFIDAKIAAVVNLSPKVYLLKVFKSLSFMVFL